MSPFQAVYGYPPPSVSSNLPGSSLVHLVDITLRNRDTLLKQLMENIQVAQQRMCQQADKHRLERTFQIVSKNHCPKLAPHYYEPFQVVTRVGSIAYTLDLPPQSRIHPTFHVSLLKPKLDAHTVASATLPQVTSDGSLLWFPERILQRGMFKRANKAVTHWLIKGTRLLKHDATWEDTNSILSRFLDFEA
ncbi:uncharacterized protein LOC126584490 [Malus sylvestris]|uniref:uncharacterized protein LOC126584490 n=1 Tax=Malus sylvestris TaxID=3752 RepID=UPI0021ACDD28|nr:uncharacterized protein LOC126584490 [Malus sylvestris]